MKSRSDDKRQAILGAAYKLFSEKGFETASVSDINVLVGGSKATIYSYFCSKERLFVECMYSVVSTYMDGIFGSLQNPDGEVSSVLKSFGRGVLSSACSPEMIAVRRLMVAEAQRAGIGKLFNEKLRFHLQQVAAYISDLMRKGQLRPGDADLAATQLRMLLEAELVEPLLLCATDSQPDAPAIAAAADRAVDTFMRAYESHRSHQGEPNRLHESLA